MFGREGIEVIGILHIVMARKSIEGNVAKNCLKHGAGAINLDRCRIRIGEIPKACKAPGWDSINKSNAKQGYRPGEYNQGDAVYEPSNLGRFPANVIFGHFSDCEMTGMKKVNVSVNHHISKTSIGGKEIYQGGHERVGYDFAGVDGKETVENWECVDGCPVKILDGQSGILHGRGNEIKAPSPSKGIYSPGKLVKNSGYISDTGGASRFFKQISELVKGE
jgi:hypothetical protein